MTKLIKSTFTRNRNKINKTRILVKPGLPYPNQNSSNV